MAENNLLGPTTHMDVQYRQTYNTIGGAIALDFTQDNHLATIPQRANNAQTLNSNKGILAGSVAAVAGNNLIGPCLGDSSSIDDMAVGIVVNDAVGNPFESSSAVASQQIVYLHGTGSVFSTDIYETKATNGSTVITYTAGDKLYASQNGLLTNTQGLANAGSAHITLIGIVLKAPTPGTDPYMQVQLRI